MNTSPLFWVCKCENNYVHFTDDDTCTECGVIENESPDADVEAIQRFFPFIPLKIIPQETASGIVFAGYSTVHPYSETGSCPTVEEAFFAIRALIRDNTFTVTSPHQPKPKANMISAIRDLVAYYRQHFHVPIECASEPWELTSWDQNGLLVGMPELTDDAKDMKIDNLTFGHNLEFGKQPGGDLIVINDLPMARVGSHWIVFLFLPTNKAATDLARKILEQRLPRMCRTYRHEMRDEILGCIAGCVHDRKRELQGSIREDSYELERMSIQMMQLSRKLETDRQVLRMFEKAPEWIKARSTRTFVDLMKLVPSTYESFKLDDDSIVGTTYQIDIDHDGGMYHFDPYKVEVDLRKGKVFISGGREVNGYIHPHVTDDSSNICWGNIGHLVNRLAGEMDLFGLFQLVHQFLSSYNSSDPYQKIEKWDPDWEEESDDEEPYCSYCDDYGHDVSECDSCWWCSNCHEYVDHDAEECPNRPKEETLEVAHAEVEPATA